MNDINPRAKLFQQARTEYSRHGEQKQDAVAKATGIHRSFIQRMEDEHNFSNGAAETTAILAKYYGVSTDYLLGLTEAPYANDHAADQLGLSAAAIQRIQALAQTEQKQLFEELLLSDEFLYFLSDLRSYLAAAKAGSMIHRTREFWDEKDRIFLDTLPPQIPVDSKLDYLNQSDQLFWQLCNQAAASGRFDSSITHALLAQLQLDEFSHTSSYGNELKHYLHDPAGDSVLLSELSKRVLDEQLRSLLAELSPDCAEIFPPEEIHVILTTLQQSFKTAVENISGGADHGND